MDGDEHGAQQRRLPADDAAGERERRQDHERAEERGDQRPEVSQSPTNGSARR